MDHRLQFVGVGICVGALAAFATFVYFDGWNPFQCDPYMERARTFMRENEKLDVENRSLHASLESAQDAQRGLESSRKSLLAEVKVLRDKDTDRGSLSGKLAAAHETIKSLQAQLKESNTRLDEVAQKGSLESVAAYVPAQCPPAEDAKYVQSLRKQLAWCQRERPRDSIPYVYGTLRR